MSVLSKWKEIVIYTVDFADVNERARILITDVGTHKHRICFQDTLENSTYPKSLNVFDVNKNFYLSCWIHQKKFWQLKIQNVFLDQMIRFYQLTKTHKLKFYFWVNLENFISQETLNVFDAKKNFYLS